MCFAHLVKKCNNEWYVLTRYTLSSTYQLDAVAIFRNDILRNQLKFVEENKPKSKLSALMEKSDTQKTDQSKSVKVPSPSPKPKAKKQVRNI